LSKFCTEIFEAVHAGTLCYSSLIPVHCKDALTDIN